MKEKLTKRSVDAAKPGKRDYFVWDTESKGFGLKVTPAGRKVFVFQYQAPNLFRVDRRMTLGTYGKLTVDAARAQADKNRERVRNGEDPAVEKLKAREAARTETVDAISELFLKERKKTLKLSTSVEYARMFKVNIVPAIGKLPVAHVRVRDVAELHNNHEHVPYLANRIINVLAAFFSWCETREYRVKGSNPCGPVARYPEHGRERFLTVAEIGALGAALVKAETVGIPPAPQHRKTPQSEATARHRPKKADTPIPASPYSVGVIRLLLFTGMREGEALTLKWSDIDFERGIATLADSKTGKSHRPLGAPALELLAGLPRVKNCPYVFPGADSKKPLTNFRRTWFAVRHEAGLAGVRLHDLRHTLASFAVGAGHSLYVTGALLGHVRPDTTKRYAHLAEDVRKAAADNVAGSLADALKGTNDTSVIPLRAVNED